MAGCVVKSLPLSELEISLARKTGQLGKLRQAGRASPDVPRPTYQIPSGEC